jgi:N-acetylglucosaminyl-diphospho-decaprenol L-rhamnosyltransferase
MDVSIVIVSWNVEEHLHACLTSLRKTNWRGLQIETIVVDSASSDGTRSMLSHSFPEVTLLALSENIGFTKANNIGFRAARGRMIMMLNPDTEVIADALVELAAILETNPAVGIVGPRTRNGDGSDQSTRRRFAGRVVAFADSTWLKPPGYRRALAAYRFDDVDPSVSGEADWLQGSALMIQREVLDGIGGLDEGYLMYFEEQDFCHRARACGWAILYVATAQIIHHGGQSSEQAGAYTQQQFQHSKLRYHAKYDGWLFARFLQWYLYVDYAVQVGLEWAKYALQHRRSLRKQRMRTYWQVMRQGLRFD